MEGKRWLWLKKINCRGINSISMLGMGRAGKVSMVLYVVFKCIDINGV